MPYKNFLLNSVLDRQEADDVDLVTACTYEALQFKYDGIWIALQLEQAGITLTSRNGLVKDVWTNAGSFPGNTIVVGEYMYGTQWSKNPEREGKVFAFDLVMYQGQDLRDKPYQIRYSVLKELVHIIQLPNLSCVQTYLAAGNVERTLSGLRRNRAFEGIVLRNWQQTYYDRIARIKLDVEDDFVVMGITEGEGKYAGNGIGAFVAGQYVGDELIEIMTVGGGISDDMRRQAYARPDLFVGRVMRCVGKGGRFASGAFRHANLVAFRDDKSPKECRFIKPSNLPTTE
jgi:ATP-dependent DNA ligase